MCQLFLEGGGGYSPPDAPSESGPDIEIKNGKALLPTKYKSELLGSTHTYMPVLAL